MSAYQIDPNKTEMQNLVAMVNAHSTYVFSEGELTFAKSGETQLVVTATPTADFRGAVVVTYRRLKPDETVFGASTHRPMLPDETRTQYLARLAQVMEWVPGQITLVDETTAGPNTVLEFAASEDSLLYTGNGFFTYPT